jgi:putative ABC transport system ATP-binding protein
MWRGADDVRCSHTSLRPVVGSLDSEMAESVMQLLEEINGAGTTIIMVTHEANLAARAKRNIHVRDGRIGSAEPDLSLAANA